MTGITTADELQEADSLRQRGVISQEEFDTFKAKLMGSPEVAGVSDSASPPPPPPEIPAAPPTMGRWTQPASTTSSETAAANQPLDTSAPNHVRPRTNAWFRQPKFYVPCMVVLILIVAAVVGVTVGSKSRTPSISKPRISAATFASWSATPTPPKTGQLTTADSTCVNAANSWSERARFLAGSEGKWRTVANDTRGPFTLAVLEAATATGVDGISCLTGPGIFATGPQLTSSSGSTSVPAPGTTETGGWASFPEYGDSLLEGQVGQGVTGVTLVLQDGSQVKATVAHGVYAAWWPGSSNPVSAEVTTPEGTTNQSSF